MKKLFTLEEVMNIASGAYSEGYLSAFNDDDVDLDNDTEVEFLIEKYANVGRENERQFHILS